MTSNCFSYDSCLYYNWSVCPSSQIHSSTRYNDVSAGWVLVAAIIVFFMKAGFMLVELSFANDVGEQRRIVIIKYIDTCASAFGFFLLGFNYIASYSSPLNIHVGFFRLTTPVLWFFKFTFASNAATIVGGCLATNRYKLRLPAAFISAFLISGIVHPLITLLIWSDHCNSLSPYRFCQNRNNSCIFSCYETEELSFIPDKLYMLDFAGGGAVHLVGGVAGLVVCCFAKLQHWRDNRKKSSSTELGDYKDIEDTYQPRNFIEWMYPPNGGSERVGEAALGVIILWFCWFAFNCGSTDSLESVMATNGISSDFLLDYSILPFHDIPSIIAVNMILASATGGILAVFIASWAQLYTRAVSVNANEIANGILASLVAITAGCPFVDYWGACFIGFFAVVLYHLGCYIEYKLGIDDTARVVPVHGLCGLWSLIAVGLLVGTPDSTCQVHATFEGLCHCELRIPQLTYGERLFGQVLGAFMMVSITLIMTSAVYGLLYVVPIRPFVWLYSKAFCLTRNGPLIFKGNWLLTSPEEVQRLWGYLPMEQLSSANLNTSIQSANSVNKEDSDIVTKEHKDVKAVEVLMHNNQVPLLDKTKDK